MGEGVGKLCFFSLVGYEENVIGEVCDEFFGWSGEFCFVYWGIMVVVIVEGYEGEEK